MSLQLIVVLRSYNNETHYSECTWFVYGRFSLQAADRGSGKPLYENREQFQTMQATRPNSSDHYHPSNSAVPQPTYGNTMRRASFDDGILDPQKVEGGGRQQTPGGKMSNQEDDKVYQNIHPNTPQRSSPTKKSHLSPVSVPVPEGYYNLTPPPLVRRHNNSNNVSPSSSPEEGSLHLAAATAADMSHGQELSIVGDSLIMNKSAHSKMSSNGDIGGTYQNVEFMRADNQLGTVKRYVSCSYGETNIRLQDFVVGNTWLVCSLSTHIHMHLHRVRLS